MRLGTSAQLTPNAPYANLVNHSMPTNMSDSIDALSRQNSLASLPSFS